MYVDDHVDAYVRVIGNDSAVGEVFNVSPNNAVSVGDLVTQIGSLCKFEGPIRWGNNPRPYDPNSLCVDGRKIANAVGWRARRGLTEGLRLTVEYWKERLTEASVLSSTVRKGSLGT